MKNLFTTVMVMGLVLGVVASANACFLGRALRGGAKVGRGAAKVVHVVRPGILFKK